MTYVNWNTDAFAFTRATDPIYKSIPFFIGMGGPGGSYGLFLDNSWRSWFDFGHKDADVTTFGAPDGPIDYYVIHGPSTAEVVRRYTDLTGRASLPPLWSLGYQQSRYSYETAAELRGIAARLRSERIPADVLWLDIDFQDRNRPFTANPVTFPDMKGLIDEVGKDGFKVVTITDLHVAEAPDRGYAPYDSGMAQDRFLHRADGKAYVAPVWPGPSLFPDFTQASTRRWWGDLFAGEVADGVAGSWNDMNEPAIFNTRTKTMPLDVQHRIDGDDFVSRIANHAEIHNVYGMQNSRATYEGLARLAPGKRPFVMTRASYAGGQRYAVTWTGDNSATWDHLKLSIHQILNLGLSGFAYSAADVSGFAGGPSPDLLTRWFEIGAFYPIFRDHSAKGTPRVEPWVDGPQHLAIRRRFVEERYRLLPYFYTLADQNARVGDPIMRPVFYDYPDVVAMSCDQSMAFTVGRSLLVAPPPNPESPQSYDVCLPAGGWFDYWSGLPLNGKPLDGNQPIQSATQAMGDASASGQTVLETPRLDYLPVYVRAGTILPRQSLVQTTSEAPKGPLQLDIYPGSDCRGELYLDAGDGFAYRKGEYLRQAIRCSLVDKTLYLDFAPREGRYQPWWHAMQVTIHGWQGRARVTQGNSPIKVENARTEQSLIFILPDQSKKSRVAIREVSK
jgi:alpha-glucosidase